MNISMNFEGYVARIIDEALRQGIAKTKAEALRLGLLELNEKYALVATNIEEIDLQRDLKEFRRMERGIASGEIRLRKAKSVDDVFT